MESHTPLPLDHKLSIIPEELTTDQLSKSARVQRAQWLRAAILGANDGLVTTATLMLGVSSTSPSRRSMILSGLAGAIAGTFSMALGEFVSVSAQKEIVEEVNGSQPQVGAKDKATNEPIMIENDGEANNSQSAVRGNSAVIRESEVGNGEVERSQNPVGAESKVMREPAAALEAPSPGRSPVMRSTMRVDKVSAEVLPNPVKAAAASGMAFLVGSIVPLISSAFVRRYEVRVSVLVAVTSIALVGFGGWGAHLGGSRRVGLSAARVLIGGLLAMAVTYWLLKLLDYDDDDDQH